MIYGVLVFVITTNTHTHMTVDTYYYPYVIQ